MRDRPTVYVHPVHVGLYSHTTEHNVICVEHVKRSLQLS